MASLVNVPATQLEILTTQALVTALGKALVKKGTVTGAEVASELAVLIPVMGKIDPLLEIELQRFAGVISTW